MKGTWREKNNNCETQSKQQNKRVVQGKNRKREQQQIQSSTPIGWGNKLGTPKEGQLYEKTNKAPGQHHLQSQVKNALSEKQLQEQTPNPDMQSMWQPHRNPTACPRRMRSPPSGWWVQSVQQWNILQQHQQPKNNSDLHQICLVTGWLVFVCFVGFSWILVFSLLVNVGDNRAVVVWLFWDQIDLFITVILSLCGVAHKL